MSQIKSANEIQLAVFKKALDISSQNSMQLIQAATRIPSNLGNSIDTFA